MTGRIVPDVVVPAMLTYDRRLRVEDQEQAGRGNAERRSSGWVQRYDRSGGVKGSGMIWWLTGVMLILGSFRLIIKFCDDFIEEEQLDDWRQPRGEMFRRLQSSSYRSIGMILRLWKR